MTFEEQMAAISQRLHTAVQIFMDRDRQHQEWQERFERNLERSREKAEQARKEADQRAKRLDEKWADVVDAINRLARIAGIHDKHRLDDLGGR